MLVVLLLPPGCLIMLALAGWLVKRWRPRLGAAMIAVSLVLLYGASTPLGAYLLTVGLQRPAPPLGEPATVGAIVVLSAGQQDGPEAVGGTTVDALSLERLRGAAEIAMRTRLPILASGGPLRAGSPPLARLMQMVLARDFHVRAAWLEEFSRNTAENAIESAAILRGAGIDTVFLVTHAWHMPRARQAFVANGVRVIAAPIAPFGPAQLFDVPDLLPTAKALAMSAYALHEWIGLVWYRVHYGYAWPP